MIDWDGLDKSNVFDERRKRLGMKTGRQLFEEAHDRIAKAEAHAAERAQREPILKAELVKLMSSRTPIQVFNPIKNPTEGLPGQNESEDDDGFYSNMSKSASGTANAKFVEMMETIPAGTELIYKSWDKTLGQWIFKGSNGKEYAIYDRSIIMFQNRSIENPGLFGLLYNTNVRNVLEGK